MNRETKQHFEHLGYFREYLIGLESKGFVLCEKDREKEGYHGRRNETLSEDIVLQNGKRLKAGTEVQTILYPLCGKMLKK